MMPARARKQCSKHEPSAPHRLRSRAVVLAVCFVTLTAAALVHVLSLFTQHHLPCRVCDGRYAYLIPRARLTGKNSKVLARAMFETRALASDDWGFQHKQVKYWRCYLRNKKLKQTKHLGRNTFLIARGRIEKRTKSYTRLDLVTL